MAGKSGVYSDEERARRAQLMNDRWADPIWRAKIAERQKASWSDPENRKRRGQTIRAAKQVPVEQRFWDKVAIGEPWDCWEWQAGKSKKYGTIGIGGGKTDRAHRVAFKLFHNRPIQESLHVLHICDNPPCCNPCHLIEGTHTQNMEHKLILSAAQINEIRRLRAETNYSYAKLAEMFGVSKRTIGRMFRTFTWEEPPP